MNEVVFTYLFMYVFNIMVFGLMKGLLRMYWVMELHMFIALIDLNVLIF